MMNEGILDQGGDVWITPSALNNSVKRREKKGRVYVGFMDLNRRKTGLTWKRYGKYWWCMMWMGKYMLRVCNGLID